MTAKVDLFYKTYPGDEEWLNFSIRSVNKFARGFRQIVIVSTRGHNYNPPPGNIPVKYIELEQPPDNGLYPNGVGYWWQMGIKLCWDQFTDADGVVVVDSDHVFFEDFSPSTWMLGDKIIWLRRPWSEVGDGIIWKKGSDYVLGKETPFSYMVAPGCYFTRQATQLFANFIKLRFAQTPEQFYLDLKHPRASEFETFGAFIDDIKHYEYVFFHPMKFNYKPWPIKQYWSWGRVSDEIRREIEGILN
ncbi:hypothetical protein [Peribacillus butanolivorans]|uniref:hypothetical protein n=1 Tax=Peribacillus butanolivorans TaxID=421767 RepID=UPI0036DD4337